MKYSQEQIGKIIENERKKLGLTQKELGEKIQVVGKQISNYEKGKLVPPLDTMLKLCEVFHCELGYLLGEADYSEGSKLETAITSTTGLEAEALSNIRKITGTERSCPNFGYEAKSYRAILNSLLSSPKFIHFMECLHELDSAASDSRRAFDEVEEKFGKARFDEAMAIIDSTTDYEHDPLAPELSPEQQEVIRAVHEAIDEKYAISWTIKVARYELFRAYEAMLESLYPSD